MRQAKKLEGLLGNTPLFSNEVLPVLLNFLKKFRKPKEKPLKSEDLSGFLGAARQIRTADLILTKDALYRLSYSSMLVPQRGTMLNRPNLEFPRRPGDSRGLFKQPTGWSY